MYFARIPSSGGGGGVTITGQRTLIYDEFTGSTLNSRWKVRRPDKQTVTVSGGSVRLQTNTDTIPRVVGFDYSNINAQCMLYDTSYGLTCVRNYTEEIKFKLNKQNDTTLGALLGVYSPFPLQLNFTNFALAQFSTNDSLKYLAGMDTMFSVPPAYKEAITTFSFNTTDWFIFRHTVLEGEILLTLKNVSTGDSINKYYTRDFTHGSYPSRPNYFYFAFGGIGRTDMNVDYILVTTPEELNPTWLVVGDSRPTGFNATSADSAYANMLKRNTTDSIQLWAGGGMGVDEILSTFRNMRNVGASKFILDFGTNNTFNSDFQTKYTRITDSVTAWGGTFYVMYQPNGGDPVAGSGMNKWLKDNFSSHIIDNWTSPGYATKTIGNGMMYDGVHETLLGMQTTYAIVKAALISFFPL
jgi:hypothetical protein